MTVYDYVLKSDNLISYSYFLTLVKLAYPDVSDWCLVVTFSYPENQRDVSGIPNNPIYGAFVSKKTNHSGGILGGMSDGSEIIVRSYVKPTPSIAQTQQTVNKDGENISINIHGRHDPVVVPRAVVVVESMCAFSVLDLMISNMSSRTDYIKSFYAK